MLWFMCVYFYDGDINSLQYRGTQNYLNISYVGLEIGFVPKVQ